MAIRTEGFQVQEMPRYVAADPSLVAFNPGTVTDGVLKSIQVANELSKRKAFLQAQADAAATRDARIAAEIAKYGVTSGTAEGEIAGTNARNAGLAAVIPHTSAADIAAADTAVALAPGNTSLGLLSQQIASGDKTFNLAMQPTVQETARIGAEAAAAAAPSASDAALAKAQLEAETSARDLAAGDTPEGLKTDAQIEEIKAAAKEKAANADYLLGRNDVSLKNAETRAATHAQLDKSFGNARDTYKAIAADKEKEGSARAIDPSGANPQFTVREAADAYNQNPSGFKAAIVRLLGGDPSSPMPAGIKAQIDSYNQLVKDAAEARQRMINVEKATHNAMGYGSESAPVKPVAGAPVISAAQGLPLEDLAPANPNMPIGPSNPQDLINAVRSGKLSPQAAKDYATKMGWK